MSGTVFVLPILTETPRSRRAACVFPRTLSGRTNPSAKHARAENVRASSGMHDSSGRHSAAARNNFWTVRQRQQVIGQHSILTSLHGGPTQGASQFLPAKGVFP